MDWLTREAAGWLLARRGQGAAQGAAPWPAGPLTPNIFPPCASTLHHAMAFCLPALDRAGVFGANAGDAGTGAAFARGAAVTAGGGTAHTDRRPADSAGARPADVWCALG